MLNVYDTKAEASARQFDFWREELCHTFVELAAERPSAGDFGGLIRHFALGPVGIVRVTADAHCVARTRAEIARSREDCYFANLQLSGMARTRQRGADRTASAGDMVLIDTRDPFSVLHEEPFDLICFKLPHGLLRPELRQSHPEPLPLALAAGGHARILRGYANAILEEAPDDLAAAGAMLADNLIALIAGAINASTAGSLTAGRLGQHQAERLHAVRAYLEANLANPDLSLADMVDRFNLSPRYIQKLFAATGSTFSHTLLIRRLDKIAAALRRPELRGRSITETAFLYGFNDFSYFSRSFRKRFGKSPRDYRSAFLDA